MLHVITTYARPRQTQTDRPTDGRTNRQTDEHPGYSATNYSMNASRTKKQPIVRDEKDMWNTTLFWLLLIKDKSSSWMRYPNVT